MKSKKLICALTAAVLCAGIGMVSCGKEESDGGTSAEVTQAAAGENKTADITEAVTERPKDDKPSADDKGGKDSKEDKDNKDGESEEKKEAADGTKKPAETTAAPETTVSTETQPTETTTVAETSAETSAVTTTMEGKGGDAAAADEAWEKALSEEYQKAAKTQASFLKTSAEGVLTLHDITGDPIPDGTYKKGDGSLIAEELDKYAENDDYTVVIKDGKTVSVTIVTDGEDGERIEETITAE